MKSKILDQFLLLIVAIVLFIGMMAPVLVLNLSRGGIFIMVFSFLYVGIVSYESLPYMKEMKNKMKGVLLLIFLQSIMLGSVFLLFYFRILQVPQNGLLIWGFMFTGLAMCTVWLFSLIIEKEKKRTGNKTD